MVNQDDIRLLMRNILPSENRIFPTLPGTLNRRNPLETEAVELFESQKINPKTIILVNEKGQLHNESNGNLRNLAIMDMHGEYQKIALGVEKDALFTGRDLLRQRFDVEREKLQRWFPGFYFLENNDQMPSLHGVLKTNWGNLYWIHVEIPPNYPYGKPSVYIDSPKISDSPPHFFIGQEICCIYIWTSIFSLAVLLAKSAIWLNKYDEWKQEKSWPGRSK
ncbi:MAG: hypothetical protein JXR73_08590 [Candidatus Omnitrophica bacterium]|nr:hypothetical protein [Candidatus Omnitrophota bacterium]